MKSEMTFDELKSFRDLVQRSKNVGDGWRQVSDALWNFSKMEASKQPAVFELDELLHRIRFAEYS